MQKNLTTKTIIIAATILLCLYGIIGIPKSKAEMMKNVQENVLREIARSRRFMKNYIVVKNLVNNPKCPLDVSLTLIKNLLVMDLKVLQGNKGVPETLRKVAFKIYKEKSTPPGHKPE